MEVSVAFVPPGGLLRQIGAGLALLVVTTTAVAGELAIQYDLRPSFAGAETANGRIEVQVRNLSGHPLSALTLRLSNQTRGRKNKASTATTWMPIDADMARRSPSGSTWRR